jgi:hypothetical protein
MEDEKLFPELSRSEGVIAMLIVLCAMACLFCDAWFVSRHEKQATSATPTIDHPTRAASNWIKAS